MSGTIERLQKKVPCLMSRRTSFIMMTFLLGGFFLIEVVVGYLTNSMALIADSFHMLSDVASLIVGYMAYKYSTEDSPRDVYTYGYARAEVLGALVNAVFLVALCFSIFIEAMKRLVILEGIENPDLVFFVGLAGLIVNIFGMFLFYQTGHGHSHGGMSHSHSHGGDSHGHSHGENDNHGHSHGQASDKSVAGSGHGHSHGSAGHGHSHASPGHGHSHGSSPGGHGHSDEKDKNPFLGDSKEDIEKNSHKSSVDDLPYPKKIGDKYPKQSSQTLDEISDIENDKADEKSNLLQRKPKNTAVVACDDGGHERKVPPTSGKSAGHLNIEGVYLHILGDALGSIIVMISALFLIYGKGLWTLYVDPSMSIIMVIIILKTSIPLLMETSKILMNSAPQHIQINEIRERLLSTIPEIKNVHELHVWQLAGDKIIASVHVKFGSPDDYDETAAKIKDFFHDEGIHSTTVQMEFERNDDIDRRGQCMVVCSLDSACDDMMCCKPEKED